MTRQVYVRVPSALVLRAIIALRAVAYDKAGHSQAPNLFDGEDTKEFHDSNQLSFLRNEALAESKRG